MLQKGYRVADAWLPPCSASSEILQRCMSSRAVAGRSAQALPLTPALNLRDTATGLCRGAPGMVYLRDLTTDSHCTCMGHRGAFDYIARNVRSLCERAQHAIPQRSLIPCIEARQKVQRFTSAEWPLEHFFRGRGKGAINGRVHKGGPMFLLLFPSRRCTCFVSAMWQRGNIRALIAKPMGCPVLRAACNTRFLKRVQAQDPKIVAPYTGARMASPARAALPCEQSSARSAGTPIFDSTAQCSGRQPHDSNNSANYMPI